MLSRCLPLLHRDPLIRQISLIRLVCVLKTGLTSPFSAWRGFSRTEKKESITRLLPRNCTALHLLDSYRSHPGLRGDPRLKDHTDSHRSFISQPPRSENVRDCMDHTEVRLRRAILDVRYDSSFPGPTLSIPTSYSKSPPNYQTAPRTAHRRNPRTIGRLSGFFASACPESQVPCLGRKLQYKSAE